MLIPLQVQEKHVSVKQKGNKIKTHKVICFEQWTINLGVSLPLNITEDLRNANKKKERPANKEKGHFKAVFQNTVFSVLNKQSIIK